MGLEDRENDGVRVFQKPALLAILPHSLTSGVTVGNLLNFSVPESSVVTVGPRVPLPRALARGGPGISPSLSPSFQNAAAGVQTLNEWKIFFPISFKNYFQSQQPIALIRIRKGREKALENRNY